MHRKLFALAMLGLVALTTGCAMCAHPYDDCYPLFTGGCDGYACDGPRAGSIRDMGGPMAGYYEEVQPGQPEMYYEGPGPHLAAPQPQVQSRRAMPQAQMQSRRATPQSQMPWHRNGQTVTQGAPNPWQHIPQADRQSAKMLSVTDETLAEVQARKGKIQMATEQPTPAPSRTARRPTPTAQ